MSWYSTEGLGTLYTNSLSLICPFLVSKAHRELRIHKGVFESLSTLHTKRWKCINANMAISTFPRCVYDTLVCYCSFTLVIMPCLIV